MNGHKISVIVPIFNVEKYLTQCLESIINQTYQNLEIILVNDGSTDFSPSICDQFALQDRRIKVIHQISTGVAEARNTGLKNITGDFLSFIDADDIIVDNFHETMLRYLLESDADIIECGFHKFEKKIDFQLLPANSKPFEIYNTISALELLMQEKLKQVLWNKLYKVEVIKGVWFEKGKINEDDFWTYEVFGKTNKIAQIFDILYYYRQHSESIMGQPYSIQRLDGLTALEERIIFMKEHFPLLENLAIKIFSLGSLWHYQQVYINSEIDPGGIYRKKIVNRVKRFNKQSIFQQWKVKEIFWYQFFINAPNICVIFRNRI